MSNTATAETASQLTDASQSRIGMGAILVPVLLSTVVTLLVVGVAVYYLLRSGKLGSSTQPAVAPVIVVAPPASHVLALEPMIVNLSDADTHAYLRASISLRIRDDEKSVKTEEKKPATAADSTATELRDTTLAVLSRQTSESLLQPDGRDKLKEALEQSYKQHLTEIPVLDVYFTDFLVQR